MSVSSIKDVADDIRGFTNHYLDFYYRAKQNSPVSAMPNPKVTTLQRRFAAVLQKAFLVNNSDEIANYLGCLSVELHSQILPDDASHLVTDIVSAILYSNKYKLVKSLLDEDAWIHAVRSHDASVASKCLRKAISKR